MSKFFLLCCVSLFFFGCGLVKPYSSYPKVEAPRSGANIAVQIVGMETWQYSFKIKIRFTEDTPWSGLIQEVETDDGVILVEYFKIPFTDGRYDHHFMEFTFPSHTRTMRLYPANVEEVDYMGNFAQLPQNKDGSLKTNIGPWWNVNYQWNKGPNGEEPDPKYGVAHETRGRVVSDDRENGSVWWSLSHKNGVLNVVLPNNEKITIGDTISTKN